MCVTRLDRFNGCTHDLSQRKFSADLDVVNNYRQYPLNSTFTQTRALLPRANIGSEFDEEEADVVPELPLEQLNRLLNRFRRRVTRSQGPVQEYPNVQTRTLEHKAFADKSMQ